MGADCRFYAEIPESISIDNLIEKFKLDVSKEYFPCGRNLCHMTARDLKDNCHRLDDKKSIGFELSHPVWCYAEILFLPTRRYMYVADGCRFSQRQYNDEIQAYKLSVLKYMESIGCINAVVRHDNSQVTPWEEEIDSDDETVVFMIEREEDEKWDEEERQLLEIKRKEEAKLALIKEQERVAAEKIAKRESRIKRRIEKKRLAKEAAEITSASVGS